MPENRSITRSPIKIVILYILITIFILVAGIRYYYKQQSEIKNDIYQDLSTITELKIGQIVNWRKERMGDAFLIFSNKSLKSEVNKWFRNNYDEESKSGIISFLNSYLNYYHYSNIILFDREFNTKYSAKDSIKEISNITKEYFNNSVKNGKPEFTNIYYCDVCKILHLDVLIPLILNDSVIGGVILRNDPNVFLFPLIQSWPANSNTAETLLISEDGEYVYYLNELRHKKGTSLNLKIKIDSSNLNIPSVLATTGKEGMFEGIDYRGVSVLSVIRKVPDSPWYMITKVDIEEIYAPVKEKAVIITILIFLTLVAVGIGFIWVWSNQKKSLQILKLEDEYHRQALVKHFEYVVKYANDIFILADKNLNIVEANDTALNIYRYSRNEFIGMNIMKLRAAESAGALKNQVKELEKSESVVYETEHKKKDGKTFPVEVSLRYVEISGKIYYQGILKDISDRKYTEKLINIRYRLMEFSINHTYNELLQKTLDEVCEFTESSIGFYHFVDPDEKSLTLQAWSTKTKKDYCTAKGEGLHYNIDEAGVWVDCVHQRKAVIHNDYAALLHKKGLPEGHAEVLRELVVPIFRNNKIVAILGVGNKPVDYIVKDIDTLTFLADVAWEIAERKRSEIEIEENHRLLNDMMDNSTSLIYILDKDGKFISVNHQLEKVLGKNRLDLIGKSRTEFMPEEIAKQHYENDLKVINSKKALSFEEENPETDGVHYYYTTKFPLFDSSGNVYGVSGISTDITEQKKSEKLIIESERKLRNTLDTMMEGCQILGFDWKYIYINETAGKQNNRPIKELIGKKFDDMWPGIEKTIVYHHLKECLELRKSSRFENEFTFPDGRIGWFDINIQPVSEGAKILSIDITDWKKAEEKIRNSENKYRSLFENSILGIYRTTPDGKIIDCNPALIKLLGYSSLEELSERNLEKYGYEPGYSRDDFKKLLEETGEIKGLESSWKKKDGTAIIVLESSKVVKDIENNLVFYEGTVEDITERKRIEDELKKSEVKYRRLYDSMMDGLVLTDMKGKITDCNESYMNMLGYNMEELKKLTYIDLTPENWHEFEKRIVNEQIITRGYSDVYEKEYIKKSGEIFPVELRTFTFHNDANENIGMWAIVRDITERKKTEEELKSSEEKFRLIFENSLIGKSMTSLDGTITVNKAFCDMLGYSESELKNINWKDITHPDDIETTVLLLKSIKEGKFDSARFEKRYIHKNGSIVWTDIRTVLQKDYNGNPLYFITAVLDLTDSKKAEKERFKLLNVIENSLNEIYIFDSSTYKFEFVNYGALKNIGFTLEEMKNMTPVDIKPEFTFEDFKEFVNPLVTGEKEILIFETIHRRKDNSDYNVEVHLQLNKQENESLFYAVINDITERKKTEELIKDSEKKFHSLFESMNEGVALHEMVFDENGIAVDYRIIDVNPAYGKHTGYRNEIVKGKLASELYGIKPFPPYFDIYKKVALTGIPEYFESYFQPLDKYFEVSVFSPKLNYFATVFTDITERKIAEEKLKDSERKLREAQELANLGYWNWDIKSGNVEWSDEVYKIFRLDKNLFIPQIDSILALSPWPEENQRDKELIQKAVESREPGFYEQKFLRPDGSIGYYSSTFQGDYDDNGELISIVGTIIDITERKKVELALQESEYFFRESQKAAKIGSYKLDFNKDLWESSEVLDFIFGIDKGYLKNVDGWLDIVFDEDRKMMEDYFFNEVIKKNNYFDKEYRIKRKSDGEIRWLLGYGVLGFDENNNLCTMIGTIQDITDRKLIQEEIKKLNEELEQRVKERTQEIEVKNAELSRMNRLFVGRELRMIELKNRIKELENKLK
ncbi:MAG: PAS domain S-box protein [Ignavibacteriae bacterium]|nr:PAS domain S-box protein [Ignavibacteriota bacterium]